MPGDLVLARQWMAKAHNDLLDAENNLNAAEKPLDTICFHCQQAAEKILKGFLVSQGCPFPPVHDLLLLLEKVTGFSSEAEKLRDSLALLNPYAVEVRYPDDCFMPALTDAQEAKSAADKVLAWAKRTNPGLF